MSQSKSRVNKIQVRNRPGAEGKITVGANTEILLNGERVRGANFIKIEIGAKKVARVMIELYAEVEVDSNFLLKEKVQVKPAMKTSDGKNIALHALSSYDPVAIVKKED